MSRHAVASALGRFINLGELDVIPGEERDAIEKALIPKFDKSNPQLLRRRAIESLGYSSTPAIDKLIKQAYSESDKAMVASALFAMGRSANDAWARLSFRTCKIKTWMCRRKLFVLPANWNFRLPVRRSSNCLMMKAST